MELEEFVKNFADQFEETDAGDITSETQFRDLDDWSSLTGLMIIGMVQDEYEKQLKANDLKKCITVKDVYNIVKSL